MPTTKYKIHEAAKKLIKGGDPSAGSNVTSGQIYYAIEGVINQLLKTEHYSLTLPGGDTIPNTAVLANYENIPVEKYKKVSRARIPAMPISLPRNMGVFNVAPSNDPDCPFIPIMVGQDIFLKNQKLLSDLISTTYKVVAGYTEFSKDISTTFRTATVDMQLFVMDISQYSEHEPLPLPADMERDVVNMVVDRFVNGPRPDKVEDSGAEPTKIEQRVRQ